MAETMTGGCACGRVRYGVRIDNDEAYLCHCRMCQRATGSISIAFKNVKKADVAWQGEPDWWQSSPIAQRSHCATCGTPVHLAYNDGDEMALVAGTVDHPEELRPTHHYGIESRLEWADIALNLPGQSTREQW